jgi:hypothetical protein
MSKSKSFYPPPTIVAFFAGGEHVRMSFWQPSPGKNGVIAWRFAAATTMVKQIIGDERERARVGWNGSNPHAPLPRGLPADDMLSVHIEWKDGAVVHVIREAPAISLGEQRKARRLVAAANREALRVKQAAIAAKRAATIADKLLRARIRKQISIHINGSPRTSTTTKTKRTKRAA